MFVCVLVAAGFALQFAFGGFEISLLASPASLFVGVAIVLLCTSAAIFSQSRLVTWLTSVPMSVCLISALCVLALVMGLTPQGATPVGGVAEVSARLGFNSMTSAWPFVLVYFVMLLSLGSLTARRLARFRVADWGFYLNHAGLWLVLFAAGLGHADIERYMVRIEEGAVERMGYDAATDHPYPLPFEVRLGDFIMEEYPPVRPSARPEPKRFASEVEITLADGRTVWGITEVNHPLSVGGWMIYQNGYDRQAGVQSKYSVLELVHDPWLGAVYAGFAMIAAGALAMVWKGRRRDGLE